jgi:hypothetical protein
MTAPPVDREAVLAELERCRRQLRELLSVAHPADLRRSSHGTRWTNEQLLFHMVFGFLIVRTLLPLVRVMGRLPAPVGRGFAAVLGSARRPFHLVNFLGSRLGARVFSAGRMGRLCDRVVARLCRSLEREPERNMGVGMPFPTSWDPYFTSYMTLADVYRYPSLHFEHHRRQLTLSEPGTDDPPEGRDGS